MITASRPIKVASFGSRRSFIPDNLPTGSQEQYTRDRLNGWDLNQMFLIVMQIL